MVDVGSSGVNSREIFVFPLLQVEVEAIMTAFIELLGRKNEANTIRIKAIKTCKRISNVVTDCKKTLGK